MTNSKLIENALMTMSAKELLLQEEIALGTITPEEAAYQLTALKERQLNNIAQIDTSSHKVKSDGHRWWINIGRKLGRKYNCPAQYYATSRDNLIDKLYEIIFKPVDPSLAEAFEEWIMYKYEVQNRSSKTIKEYRAEWNSFIKGLPISEKPIFQISVDDISEAFFSITKNHAITKKRYVNVKTILKGIFAYYRKYLHFNPVEDFDDSILKGQFSSGGENLNNYYTDQDIALLCNYLKAECDPYSLAIYFSCHVALRIGEIIALRYSDYDPVSHTLKIVRSTRVEYNLSQDINGYLEIGEKIHKTESRLKGNLASSKRFIPLPKDAEAIIEKTHMLYPSEEFLFNKNGAQLNPDTFNRHLEKACNSVGISYHSSHKLRFYNAKRLYNLVGLEKTSLILGHSTTAQTLQYIKQSKLTEDDVFSINEGMNILN